MNYAVAVLDIGKTNKKVAIYVENMNPLTVGKRKIGTVPFSRQGLNLDVEDVETVEAWFLEQLAELAGEYPIKSHLRHHPRSRRGLCRPGRQTRPARGSLHQRGGRKRSHPLP